MVVRSESSDARVASFPGREHRVSIDGRWIAYWHPGEGSTLDRLYVAAAAGGSPTRSLMTVQPEQKGGPIAWSSDGTGLVVAVDSGHVRSGNHRSELHTVDLVTAAPQLLFTTGNGASWHPLGWDRAGLVVGAGMTKSGFLDSYAAISLKGQRPAMTNWGKSSSEIISRNAIASSDARYVAAIGRGNQVYWWPFADGTRTNLAQREVHSSGLAWKPGTSQIGWVGGPIWSGCTLTSPPICGGSEIVLLDVATGRRTVAARINSNLSLEHFRDDGSAAMLRVYQSNDVAVIDLATGRTEQVKERWPVLASVRIR
jgi:hypothetical protein